MRSSGLPFRNTTLEYRQGNYTQARHWTEEAYSWPYLAPEPALRWVWKMEDLGLGSVFAELGLSVPKGLSFSGLDRSLPGCPRAASFDYS